MAISKSSCVAGALVLIIASGFVLTSGEAVNADADGCANFSKSCVECLNSTFHPGVECLSYEFSSGSQGCSKAINPDPLATVITDLKNCSAVDPTTTTTPATTTTSATTTTTTPTPTTTVTTTTSTTTTPAPPTPAPTPTPTPTNSTTTTTPAPSTTTAPPTTTPAPPHGGGMSWASFFGGIVFTAAVLSVAYLVWRFYKARQERNYHTLTTNLI